MFLLAGEALHLGNLIFFHSDNAMVQVHFAACAVG
jgi:hypothetical protein